MFNVFKERMLEAICGTPKPSWEPEQPIFHRITYLEPSGCLALNLTNDGPTLGVICNNLTDCAMNKKSFKLAKAN